MSLYQSDLDKIPNKPLTDKCIVLDLDETLVHSSEKLENLVDMGIMSHSDLIDLRKRTYRMDIDDVVYKKGTGIKTSMWGITRPNVRQFLIECFSYFKIVAVWSAGRKKYVEAIVDYLFKDLRRPHIIYTYDNCERTSSGLIVKPLRKMINNVKGLSKYMSLKNTFMIDDRTTVYSGFENDNPDNGIQIPAYKPDFETTCLKCEDDRLKQLVEWFHQSEVIKSKDVRKLDKSKVFK